MTKLDFGALLSPRVVMLGVKRLFTALTSHYASKSLKIGCLRMICILFFKHTSRASHARTFFLRPLHCSEMSLQLVFHASWRKPVTKFNSSEINLHTPNRFCRLWYASKSLYLAGAYLILWLKIEIRQTRIYRAQLQIDCTHHQDYKSTKLLKQPNGAK